ncbi:outer membrane lipoprotein carrier protein LolA [Alteromonas ponticola]|uniref:Outer membrane lipoprotein carrier protein LolA n=1 Tax=Alteromonas ponticola TaxID=2720613 RepID=A0ABX1R2I0_9ALTE|nr:outer membrane lipoprotein carrier protein LolA [Alteromonas ponticola]NMH60674.1 outer membrane lipoprotein carrier protein LolA [Alteromonas ponticola]
MNLPDSVWRWLLGGMVLLVSSWLSADEGNADEKALLTDLFPSKCHFSGQFTQTKAVAGLPVPLKSNGDFFFSCDLGLIWRTHEPFNEAILYVNSTNNFRVNEDGSLASLTGVTRYIMSNVFVKLLKGDAAYFIDEFAISQADDDASITLTPQSDFMKKGIQHIRFNKSESEDLGITLFVDVMDATGQATHVSIDTIVHYDIEGKRRAFEQCEKLYSQHTDWCQVLRSPSRVRQ